MPTCGRKIVSKSILEVAGARFLPIYGYLPSALLLEWPKRRILLWGERLILRPSYPVLHHHKAYPKANCGISFQATA
jgi:hypothetical protein